MFVNIKIKLAVSLEKKANKIKRKIRKEVLNSFLNEYGLKEGTPIPKKDIRFNPYEGTNLLLLDKLINSGMIDKDEVILDVGAGTGILLFYMAKNGYKNLYGIEHEDYLYNIFIENLKSFKSKFSDKEYTIEMFKGNAIEMPIKDDITCFYLFNTFYDKETYMKWINNVKKSLKRKNRHIKIILLYPTVASMGAMRECEWLYEKGRIVCDAQMCHKCVNYLIYENKE